MRRTASLLICLFMLFALSACGGPQMPGEAKAEETDTANAVEKTGDKVTESTPKPSEAVPQTEADPELTFAVKTAWLNYSEDSRIFENALNSAVISETMLLSSARHLPLFRFDSISDVEKFASDYADIFTFDQGYDEIPSFNDTVSAYDEDFFSDHCLLCVYFVAGSGSFRYGVRDTETENSALRVNIEQTNAPETYTDDMAGWLIFVEMEKADLRNFTEYDAQYVGKKK